jgi:hypothetical protein
LPYRKNARRWQNPFRISAIASRAPSYFDVSLSEGYSQATPEEWNDAYIKRLREQEKQ